MQAPFGIRFGRMTANTIEAVGCSLVAGNINVAVDGIGAFNITLTEIGADAPVGHDMEGLQAGFVGNTQITGLSSFTLYTYTATQGANNFTGSFRSAPGERDDFALVFTTCDNNTVGQGIGGSDGQVGMDRIKDYAQNGALPLVAIIQNDDFGYMDSNGTDDKLGTGHYQSSFIPTIGRTEYDYSLGAFGNFGLFSDLATDSGFSTWGHELDRQWVWKNVPIIPQWGDHDAGIDDIGWDVHNTDAPEYGLMWTHANTVWDRFFKPLQGGGLQNRDTSARHYGFNLGCLKFLVPDGITNASGDAVDASPWDTVPTVVYGSNQVDDVLDYIDVDPMPFVAMTMNYSVRHLKTPTTQQNGGAQNPIGSHADYARLVTDTGNAVKSLMENPRTNGEQGVFFTLHGDNHQAIVTKNENTDGALNELFTSICAATINGSTNFSSGLSFGDNKDGSTVLAYDSGGFEAHESWLCILEVYGSKATREVQVTLSRNSDQAVIWSGKFVENSGNVPSDLTTDNFDLVKIEPWSDGWDLKTNLRVDGIDSILLNLQVMAQLTVIDKDLTAPPAAPDDGDIYIIGSVATGAWVGFDGQVAVWSDNANAWAISAPAEGWHAWLKDENAGYIYDGSAWVIESTAQNDAGILVNLATREWTIRTSAADNNWFDITWSPALGLFVAVANSGTGNRVMTSLDGINWTIRTSAEDNNWASIAWSPALSLFVAVANTGTDNRVMTSPDGINWTIRTSAADNSWLGITWSPELSLFAAVASSGTDNRVMTSPDGINWTSRTSAADNGWNSIAWSPELGLFVAVANSGTGNRVMTSPDGINWTIRTSAADDFWNDIAWSPALSLFVVAGAKISGTGIMTSPDGINWTSRTSAADNNWTSIAWSPELRLFAAVANGGTGNRAMTSLDGINWTSRISATDNNWAGIAWSPELSLFAAIANTGTDNRVMTSC